MTAELESSRLDFKDLNCLVKNSLDPAPIYSEHVLRGSLTITVEARVSDSTYEMLTGFGTKSCRHTLPSQTTQSNHRIIA